MIIVQDVDGVLASFESGFVKILRTIEPSIKIDEYAQGFPAVWDWPEHAGYSKDTISRAWREVTASENFWATLNPMTNAYLDVQQLRKAHQLGHYIYFCTTRPGVLAKHQTERWLEMLHFENPTVVVCGEKGLFCQSVKADLIIDDKPENLMACLPTKRALFRHEYNREHWNTFDMTVNTVREALAYYAL